MDRLRSFHLEFILVLDECLAVDWKDISLRPLGQRGDPGDKNKFRSIAIFVLAPLNANILSLSSFLTACIIFCVLKLCRYSALHCVQDTLGLRTGDPIES